MLKKVVKDRQAPAPVQVRKGKWGYNVWIFKREESRNGKNYFRYELAHPASRKFVREQDAITFGYARIYKQKCPLFFMPMRHKPKQESSDVTILGLDTKYPTRGAGPVILALLRGKQPA
jgi:hypothetical protein